MSSLRLSPCKADLGKDIAHPFSRHVGRAAPQPASFAQQFTDSSTLLNPFEHRVSRFCHRYVVANANANSGTSAQEAFALVAFLQQRVHLLRELVEIGVENGVVGTSVVCTAEAGAAESANST